MMAQTYSGAFYACTELPDITPQNIKEHLAKVHFLEGKDVCK